MGWLRAAVWAAVLITPPGEFVRDAVESERVHAAVSADLDASLIRGIRTRDWALVGRSLTPSFRGRFPGPDSGRTIPDGSLGVVRYDHDHEASDELRPEPFLGVLRAHVDPWVEVQRASWRSFSFLLQPGGNRAFCRAHLRLGGTLRDGGRAFLDTTVEAWVARGDSGPWRIDRLALVDGRRVTSRRSRFRDVTDQVGLHFNTSADNLELRQSIIDTRANLTFMGLTVLDWNRDGFWDLLVTESLNRSVLFVNDGRGGFVLGQLPFDDRSLAPSHFLYVDLDNDGLEELVGNEVHLYEGDRAWIGLHTRRDGHWVFLPRALPIENRKQHRFTGMQSISTGDVNGDGLLDLFFGVYETNRSRIAGQFNLIESHDGADNLLFVNHGQLSFREESDSRGITGTQYTFVSQLFDLDGDGDPDLFEGNDYGRNVVWDNDGKGHFKRSTDHPLAQDPNYTMGLSLADWDNTGSWSLYLSNMYSHSGQRVVGLGSRVSEAMHGRLLNATRGNQLFTHDRLGGQWQERAVALGVNEADWAWGNAFVDLDNDGDRDLVVTNGNTSFRDRKAPDY